MITHIVLWRIKENHEGMEKSDITLRMVSSLKALKDVIPCIKALETGVNVNPGEMAADVALFTQFESEQDLSEYQSHPAHQEVAKFIGAVARERRVVDFS